MKNNLLSKIELNELPLFGEINTEEIVPAVENLIESSSSKVNSIGGNNANISWELIEDLNGAHDHLNLIWNTIDHLMSVNDSDKLRKAHDEVLPKISEYYAKLGQNKEIFNLIERIKESDSYGSYNKFQKRVISNILRDFRLSGVALEGDDRSRYLELVNKLSELSNKFSHNVLDATYGWSKLITNKDDLSGIPDNLIYKARKMAGAKNLDGWLFDLSQPTYIAIMKYADCRDLRKEFHFAYSTRASEIGPNKYKWDNSKNIIEILKIRKEISELLGFSNPAELSMQTKMAKHTENVLLFLNRLVSASKEQAIVEFDKLKKFSKIDLMPWDILFHSEKLKEKLFSFSDENVREYFPVNTILKKMFGLANRLFGINIKKVDLKNKWHEDVLVFEVFDSNQQYRAKLFIDLYAREGKRNGAWMNDFVSRRKNKDGDVRYPVAFIVCNFGRSNDKSESLLLHRDVETLFHEFGHALQHMLTNIDYEDISGINGVLWDAVELPSQFMENWCWQNEVLNIPDDVFKKLVSAKNFQSALLMLRQLEFAIFDMKIHLDTRLDVLDVLKRIRDEISVVPSSEYDRFPNSFTHIFAGGYSAGYYSYKWAEVLSADVFSKFKENGLFSKKIGEAFLKYILESGGSDDPAVLFRQFMGRDPDIDSLLSQLGIKRVI